MYTDTKSLAKHRITAIIVSLQQIEPYNETTHATNFKHNKELYLHKECNKHMHNSMKAFLECLAKDLLIDLETSCVVIGYMVTEIYTHIKDNFLLPCEISCVITKTKETLNVLYNPNEIV